MATFKNVIEQFMAGEKEGASSGQGNLKIKNDSLIHYYTPILERYGEGYILNYTRYSLVTGRLQKQIRNLIPENELIIVTGVPEGYQGTLKKFVKKCSDI